MTTHEFIAKYREAFSESTPLPVAFGYGDRAVTEAGRIPRCMVGAIRKVCDGEPLTLSADNVLCGGGGLYTAFAPMPDRVPAFVSETEHYKQTAEQVREQISRMDIRLSDKPYLNFVRIRMRTVRVGLLQHSDLRGKRERRGRPPLLHRHARPVGASAGTQRRADVHHTGLQV